MQDLLDPLPTKDIVIRETPNGEIFVEGLCRVRVEDAESALSVFEDGDADRTDRAGCVKSCSRSHVIALVYLEQRCTEASQAQEPGTGKMTQVGVCQLFMLVLSVIPRISTAAS